MRTRPSFFAALLVAGLSWTGAAQAADPSCTPATLNGLYEFSASGYTVTPAGAALPKSVLELIHFNGDGTLSVPGAVVSVNGTITIVPPGGTGTYAVSPIDGEAACAGSLAFLPNGPHFALLIRPDAVTLRMFQTDQNNVFQGTATLVSP